VEDTLADGDGVGLADTLADGEAVGDADKLAEGEAEGVAEGVEDTLADGDAEGTASLTVIVSSFVYVFSRVPPSDLTSTLVNVSPFAT